MEEKPAKARRNGVPSISYGSAPRRGGARGVKRRSPQMGLKRFGKGLLKLLKKTESRVSHVAKGVKHTMEHNVKDITDRISRRMHTIGSAIGRNAKELPDVPRRLHVGMGKFLKKLRSRSNGFVSSLRNGLHKAEREISETSQYGGSVEEAARGNDQSRGYDSNSAPAETNNNNYNNGNNDGAPLASY